MKTTNVLFYWEYYEYNIQKQINTFNIIRQVYA